MSRGFREYGVCGYVFVGGYRSYEGIVWFYEDRTGRGERGWADADVDGNDLRNQYPDEWSGPGGYSFSSE